MSSGEVVDGTVVVLKMGDTRTGVSADGNGPVERSHDVSKEERIAGLQSLREEGIGPRA